MAMGQATRFGWQELLEGWQDRSHFLSRRKIITTLIAHVIVTGTQTIYKRANA